MAATRFSVLVLNAVRRIPPGRVATYGDVAAVAGRPRAWRAVGNIMRECQQADVPCHRVVASGGGLGGYGDNPALKRALLRAEGVIVVGRRIRQWSLVRWVPAPSGRVRRNRTVAPAVSQEERRRA
ncbi:MAG: MGMT family protein [Acidobacteria bacterium]|nr:MGMT family protein [Acidobacteriota bacterium]